MNPTQEIDKKGHAAAQPDRCELQATPVHRWLWVSVRDGHGSCLGGQSQRLHGMEEVIGSIPTRSTNRYHHVISYLKNSTNCWTKLDQEWQGGYSA